ncbi:histidine triad nucleotide-binding protein 2 mitochondrial [Penicillium macrosclerotiorum]|uniref:histidine triad nucleotide-binding protein 2 mitochondrial n=1 Tax=Penicillium macrosclerotiorum TaxID=303699 RepID=UPI002548C805|nr:histidine triad nucleotide-binding protein 2 mitochondrial [Penicillium macrosclerotiorum]KAJ5679771.1 histidine triad nucleotide-binding protein 2 mitochondrial [Penicillium macrosclerotiorum]
MSTAACIFCKIIKGMQPRRPHAFFLACATRSGSRATILFESDKVFAFLDIQPLSRGHALVIPKFHGAKLTDIPDEDLLEILPVAKKIAIASGATDYNILQNNGRIAHQVVDHIPKPNEQEGMSIGWPTQETDMDKLKALFEEIKAKM